MTNLPHHKNEIATSFSRVSNSYDAFSNVQKKTAGHLMEILMRQGIQAQNILEIGCATGGFTQKIAEFFPKSHITAIDISPEMIKKSKEKLTSCPHITFLCCDAEVFVTQNEFAFDLIVSNAAFQWFENLEETIAALHKQLAPNGRVIFSYFGPKTLMELGAALKMIFGKQVAIKAEQFLSIKKIEILLQKKFVVVDFEHLIYEEQFAHILELLRQLKYTGVAVRQNNKPIVFNKKLLGLLENEMTRQNKNGKLAVNYEVGFFSCSSPTCI